MIPTLSLAGRLQKMVCGVWVSTQPNFRVHSDNPLRHHPAQDPSTSSKRRLGQVPIQVVGLDFELAWNGIHVGVDERDRVGVYRMGAMTRDPALCFLVLVRAEDEVVLYSDGSFNERRLLCQKLAHAKRLANSTTPLAP